MLDEHLSLLDVDPGSVVFIIDRNSKGGRAVTHNDGNRRKYPRGERLFGGGLSLHADATRGDVEEIFRIAWILSEDHIRMRENLEAGASGYSEARIPVLAREHRLCDRNLFRWSDRPILSPLFC